MRRHCQNWQINLEINFVFVFYYLRTKQTKGNNKGNKSNNNNKGSCNESRCLLTALTLSCLYLPLSLLSSPFLSLSISYACMLAIFHFLCAPLLSKLFLFSFIIILLFFLSLLLLLLLIIHTRYTYASKAALHFWALLSLSFSLPLFPLLFAASQLFQLFLAAILD